MRTTMALVLSLGLFACSKSADEGAEAARRQAEKEQKEKESAGGVAKKISPPVPGSAKLYCANVVRADLFRQGREVEIDHQGRIYRLRLTQLNKLILTA